MLGFLARMKNCSDRLVKHGFEAFLREGRTLEILDSPDFLGCHLAFLVRDRMLFFFFQTRHGELVFPEIQLRADQYKGDARRMVGYFRYPLHTTLVNTLAAATCL